MSQETGLTGHTVGTTVAETITNTSDLERKPNETEPFDFSNPKVSTSEVQPVGDMPGVHFTTKDSLLTSLFTRTTVVSGILTTDRERRCFHTMFDKL